MKLKVTMSFDFKEVSYNSGEEYDGCDPCAAKFACKCGYGHIVKSAKQAPIKDEAKIVPDIKPESKEKEMIIKPQPKKRGRKPGFKK